MALEALAREGHFFHIYDFRIRDDVEPGAFVASFNRFDYSDDNPMHRSPAQVKDGVLVQHVNDPRRFWLIGEWRDIEEHARIRRVLADSIRPEFIAMIEGGRFVPEYGRIVSATPQSVLDRAGSSAGSK
jgi:hypothetical protein